MFARWLPESHTQGIAFNGSGQSDRVQPESTGLGKGADSISETTTNSRLGRVKGQLSGLN
jgi:hypothetical protein